ncbi:sensor histidine kinase [Ruminococcus sp. AF17-22AC]|jgi:two-component system, sensor histidine kinase YesM|uniref:sensor histidine kinase n=1 Tax=Ruminococcus sp. AF17-22AC TaxID=2292248 RepID=UPI000E4C0A2B|nr:histidine kinase [Ruminococcus sp. AF17-22AC]RGU27687.1 sensor histidine kinase [Ruminococcus sp. AF17-22AC]
MDNKKKVIYTNYIFSVLIMINVVLLALCFILQVSVLILAVLLAEIVILSVVLMLLNKQDVYIKNFLLNHENKYLRKLYMFHSPEEGKLYEFMINNKDENRNLFLASKREAQILALQNQINPHFLYNTLETIRSEAIINGAVNAGTMAEALATFFRYTISNLDYLVQIEDELENIQNYFTIQHYRFGNKIGIQITYDEEDKNILRLYIPKLIMQPVVENAIYHGIEQKLGAGQVTISISYTKQNLDIMISDDGIGIKDTELSEINNRLWTDSENYGYEKSEKSGGIAIRNVNQRIKLLFGEEYGIWLNSIYGIGTDVHIKLPVVLTPDDLEKKLRIDKEDVGGQSGKGTGTL